MVGQGNLAYSSIFAVSFQPTSPCSSASSQTTSTIGYESMSNFLSVFVNSIYLLYVQQNRCVIVARNLGPKSEAVL